MDASTRKTAGKSRLKVRNLLTGAVLDKAFKAGEKFKEPDMQLVPVSYLYSDGDGSYFLD